VRAYYFGLKLASEFLNDLMFAIFVIHAVE